MPFLPLTVVALPNAPASVPHRRPTKRLGRIAPLTFAVAAILALCACSGEESNRSENPPPSGDAGPVTPDAGPPTQDATGGDATTEPDADAPEPPVEPTCDGIDPHHCMFPWPSNVYLAPDATRATGYTLNYGVNTLPPNRRRIQADPASFARMDGYGLGTPAMVVLPNVDISAMAREDSIERSLEADAPVVVLEIAGEGNTSARRVPYWVELDARAVGTPERQTLFVRFAEILKPNTRYVVAMRNVKTTAGAPMPRSDYFDRLVRGVTDTDEALAARQPRFDEIFAFLEAQGVARDSLTVAWDFHTASSDALNGEMLEMRRRAFEATGEQGPALQIERVEEYTEQQDEHIALELRGSLEVPHFLEEVPVTGALAFGMTRDAQGRPEARGTRRMNFVVRIPRSALDGTPHGLVMYGHGMLGRGTEVRAGYNGRIANAHKLIFFAADFLGFCEEDVPLAIASLADISHFHRLVDRMHQGLVEWLLLTRTIDRQLAGHEALTSRNIAINPDEMFYSGISQGGIYGASFMALTQDIARGHLGVPGVNYAMLMDRSVNFGTYFTVLRNNYPDRLDQNVNIAVIQGLWDKIDPVSYMRHISHAPFEDDAPRQVLLVPAKTDYQVAVVTNEIVARSQMGIALMENYGHPVALVESTAYPHQGSGIVLYDFGNPWPPHGNVAPPEDPLGDPHAKPRQVSEHNEQMVHFWRTGEIKDVCNGEPCRFP